MIELDTRFSCFMSPGDNDRHANQGFSKYFEKSGADPLTGANRVSILLYKHVRQRCALGQGASSGLGWTATGDFAARGLRKNSYG